MGKNAVKVRTRNAERENGRQRHWLAPLQCNAVVPIQTVFRRKVGAVKIVGTFFFCLVNVCWQHKSMSGESGKSVSLLLPRWFPTCFRVWIWDDLPGSLLLLKYVQLPSSSLLGNDRRALKLPVGGRKLGRGNLVWGIGLFVTTWGARLDIGQNCTLLKVYGRSRSKASNFRSRPYLFK